MQTRVPRIIAAILSIVATGLAQNVPASSVPGPAKDEAVQMSVFEVSTSKDIGYQSANAAEVTRMNTPIQNIPINVTIFNQQFVDDLVATDTSQLLAYDASSVKTSENDGFLARGSSSVGSNFLNGFAQTSGFGSQPLANIERVEVIRGPAAVLYGSGGYGGTYNRITKQAQPKPFTTGRLILSDYHSYRVELDENVGGLPVFGGKKLLFRVNGIIDRGFTWFGQRKKEDAIAPTLRWDVGPKTKVIFEYMFDWRENQASWETPVHLGDPHGMLTGDGTYHVMPRRIAWMIPEDYRRNTRRVASTDVRHAFTNNLQFRSQFQYESKDQNIRETIPQSDGLVILRDTALVPRSFRWRPQKTLNYRLRNEVVWNVATGPVDHRLLLGHGWQQQYDWNYTYITSANYGGLSGANLLGTSIPNPAASAKFFSYPNVTYAQMLADPTLAGFNPNLVMPLNLFDRSKEKLLAGSAPLPPLLPSAFAYTYLANTDIYANDVFSVFKDRVFVMAGVRHSQVTRKTINFASGTFPNTVFRSSAPTVYRSPAATTSSFGAVWHLNAEKTYSLYANFNTSFSPQFNIQPDGSDLNPENG
jgi:outer membrane receptor protein involved in Fe transport